MITDARTLADGAMLQADVCIAGAGAAGMTIALDLRASGLSVLLLESGGAEAKFGRCRDQAGKCSSGQHQRRLRARGPLNG